LTTTPCNLRIVSLRRRHFRNDFGTPRPNAYQEVKIQIGCSIVNPLGNYFLGASAAIGGGWLERVGPRQGGCRRRVLLCGSLAQPADPRDNGLVLTAALKRRAEVMRLIERAESEWLAAEESLEREAG